MAVAVRAIAFATRPCYLTAYVLSRPRCRGEVRYTENGLAHQHDDADVWPLGSRSHYRKEVSRTTTRTVQPAQTVCKDIFPFRKRSTRVACRKKNLACRKKKPHSGRKKNLYKHQDEHHPV